MKLLVLTAMEVERRAVLVGVRRYQSQGVNSSTSSATQLLLPGVVRSGARATTSSPPSSAAPTNTQCRIDNLRVELIGVGAESAARRLPAVINSAREQFGRIDRILLVGFSGGLISELQPGDVIIADQIVDAKSHEVIAIPSHEFHGESGKPANKIARQTWRAGSVITTNRPLATTEDKRAMRTQVGTSSRSADPARVTGNDCLTVDMESFAVASMIRDAGLLDRLTVARIVIDPFDLSLPMESANWLTADGRARPMRVLADLVRRPRLLSTILRLAKLQRKASEAASEFVERYLTLLSNRP